MILPLHQLWLAWLLICCCSLAFTLGNWEAFSPSFKGFAETRCRNWFHMGAFFFKYHLSILGYWVIMGRLKLVYFKFFFFLYAKVLRKVKGEFFCVLEALKYDNYLSWPVLSSPTATNHRWLVWYPDFNRTLCLCRLCVYTGSYGQFYPYGPAITPVIINGC